MTLVAFALAYAGLAAVCFAMEPHHRQIFGSAPARKAAIAVRCGGLSLLALALLGCVNVFPGSLGVVVWLGSLTAAALPLAFLLPFAPRAVAVAAVSAPFVAAALAWALVWT